MRDYPAFDWPSFSEERVLLVGIGGGADIISAYALSQVTQAREKLYANTKTYAEPDWIFLSPHIARLPNTGGGRTALERMLPKGDRGCPLVFLLQKEREPAIPTKVSIQRDNSTLFSKEIAALQVDRIIAIDTGGDVLSKKPGRDQEMLLILCDTGLPVLLVVLAPGVDGQSKRAALESDLARATAREDFCGAFALDALVPIFEQYSASMRATRTPNLILAAYQCEGAEMKIPRGCSPVVPVSWLRAGFVWRLTHSL